MEKYPKLADDEDCAFPNRDDCNYGKGYERCPYMKYDNSASIFDPNRWFCEFKRNKIKENLLKSEKANSDKEEK